MKSLSSGQVQNTDLYKKFLEMRDHVLKNKWYMSEKEGRDVGFERALINYISFHQKK